jgi:5,10-methylenetetrahydromethanopterin reductase
MLGLLAGATQKIRLGLGVTNPYTRNPALLAMSAATMDVLSGGRFLLGLGRSERESIEGEMGIHYGSPLERLEESVKSLRRLFKGEPETNPALGVTGITLKLKPRSADVPIAVCRIFIERRSAAAEHDSSN